MILLNFWPADLPKRVGHVSLLIGAGQSDGQQTYVSWWPGKDDGSKEMGVPVQPYTYDQDVVAEGGPPSGRVSISGLDEARMKRTWEALLAKKARYYLLGRNCAWTVKVLLDAGTGVDHGRLSEFKGRCRCLDTKDCVRICQHVEEQSPGCAAEAVR